MYLSIDNTIPTSALISLFFFATNPWIAENYTSEALIYTELRSTLQTYAAIVNLDNSYLVTPALLLIVSAPGAARIHAESLMHCSTQGASRVV
jgi:hypothetical protein